MAKYRKKPVVIEAYQLPATDMDSEVTQAYPPWLLQGLQDGTLKPVDKGAVLIPTLEGSMRADAGDWIIKGVKGELYPCKPDIFEATYEKA